MKIGIQLAECIKKNVGHGAEDYELRNPNYSELFRTVPNFRNSIEYVNRTSKSPKEQTKGI